MLTTLDDLPDHAAIRVFPSHPALTAEQAATVVDAVGKLFVQYLREDAVTQAAVTQAEHGSLIVVAWVPGPGEGLSGCRKDKLAKVLGKYGQDLGVELLAPPPLVVAVDGQPTCFLRGSLRQAYAHGSVTDDSLTWDTRADTVGAWRQGQRVPVRDSWLAGILSGPSPVPPR